MKTWKWMSAVSVAALIIPGFLQTAQAAPAQNFVTQCNNNANDAVKWREFVHYGVGITISQPDLIVQPHNSAMHNYPIQAVMRPGATLDETIIDPLTNMVLATCTGSLGLAEKGITTVTEQDGVYTCTVSAGS